MFYGVGEEGTRRLSVVLADLSGPREPYPPPETQLAGSPITQSPGSPVSRRSPPINAYTKQQQIYQHSKPIFSQQGGWVEKKIYHNCEDRKGNPSCVDIPTKSESGDALSVPKCRLDSHTLSLHPTSISLQHFILRQSALSFAVCIIPFLSICLAETAELKKSGKREGGKCRWDV